MGTGDSSRERCSNEELVFYKNRILNFILNNPGVYGLAELEEMFGFKSRRLQDFITEYNKMGFNIKSLKGKYTVTGLPSNFKAIQDIMEKQGVKKYAIYSLLKREFETNGSVNRNSFISNCEQSHVMSLSASFINKLIGELEKDGCIHSKNGFIYLYESPFDKLSEEGLLKLLIFMNIMKNIYPRGSQLHQIYSKLLLKYESTGNKFCHSAVNYPHKNRISIYDELILEKLEEAVVTGQALRITYKIGAKNIGMEVKPAGLIYNGSKDLWYLVEDGEQDKLFRLDKIIDMEVMDSETVNTEDKTGRFDRKKYNTSLWVSNETEEEVEVQFDKHQFIYKKLMEYKALRENAFIEETERYYILKDKVCGINEFSYWVRAFGRSAICIKPQALREKIINDIRLMKERYGE